MNEQERIDVCKTSVNQIYGMLRSAPQSYRNYVGLGRSVIAHIDATTFMQRSNHEAEQAWMVSALQSLAAIDSANGDGSTGDITTW